MPRIPPLKRAPCSHPIAIGRKDEWTNRQIVLYDVLSGTFTSCNGENKYMGKQLLAGSKN